jgi:hypothetical protein
MPVTRLAHGGYGTPPEGRGQQVSPGVAEIPPNGLANR